MSTPQTSSHVAPRFRIGLGTVLTALGVLVAVAVTIAFLALTGANHTTVPTPVTASQVAAGSTPQTHYLGPRQQHAPTNPRNGGLSTTAGVGNRASHYSCLGAAQRCLR